MTNLASVTVAAGSRMNFGWSATASKFSMALGAGTPVLSTVTVVANTWHRLEFRFKVGVTPRLIGWTVDGTAQTSVSLAQARPSRGSGA